MKLLFVHQNFPGQYVQLIHRLLLENSSTNKPHLIVFLTEEQTKVIPGVVKVIRREPTNIQNGYTSLFHRDAFEFERAMQRSEATFHASIQLKRIGFTPDIIIGHHGWGELLSLQDVFPNVPVLGYFEFFYHSDRNDVTFDPEFPISDEILAGVRAKNAINLLALALNQYGQTPTIWQRNTYPTWSHSSIEILHEGVLLNQCCPMNSIKYQQFNLRSLSVNPQQRLITFVARNLEPYRGFHTFMRSLPKILRDRPEAVVAVVGGDSVSYGTRHREGSWRYIMLRELEGKIDLDRVHFLGHVAYKDYLFLLRRSDIHVYLSYPFVASWSLREALACGCAVIGFDNIMTREFISHQKNGILVQGLSADDLGSAMCLLLENPSLTASLGREARSWAEAYLDADQLLKRYRQHIDFIVQGSLPEAMTPTARRSFELNTNEIFKLETSWAD